MAFVIRIVEAVGLIECAPGFSRVDCEGEYLKAFDVDAHDGLGSFESTADIEEALHFSDLGDVLEAWKRQSTVRPLRPDGKPNRPLTALTISPERAP
jgi:hypothetical protein